MQKETVTYQNCLKISCQIVIGVFSRDKSAQFLMAQGSKVAKFI